MKRQGGGSKVLVAVVMLSISCSGGGSQSSPDAAPTGSGGAAGRGSGGSTGGGGGGGTPTGAGGQNSGIDGGAGAIPFTGGVYFVGSRSPGACGGDVLERFWPTRATNYYTGFGCNALWYQFRPTDEQLVYQDLSKGLLIDGAGNADTLVPTPPCGDSINALNVDFGYDGQGRLYYQCSNTLLRDNGESLVDDIDSLNGVLADGRTIVTRAIANASTGRFEVLGPDGTTVSVLDAATALGGLVFPVGNATIAGNDGYVIIEHMPDYLNSPAMELVVYHLNAASQWNMVRRFPSTDTLTCTLVISDGTVFVREQASPTSGDRHVIAYPPGSETPIEVLREGDSPVIDIDNGCQMLVGPHDASGPSVVSE
jgi:hypothetical protein